MNFSSAAPPSRGAIAASAQDLSEAEFAELDELLAGIPEPLEPLDVVMLDGFLCGVIVQPRLLESDEWLPFVFDAGGHRWGEAEPAAEQVRARVLILRRHAALNRSIAEFGGFDPFVLEPMDAEGGDAGSGAIAEAKAEAGGSDKGAAVESAKGAVDDASPVDPITATLAPWVSGFEQALQLLPDLADLADPTVDMTLARLFRFLPREGGEADAVAEVVERERPLASLDDAMSELIACVAELYDLTTPLRYKVEAMRRETPKVGRNDPCPCGSGRKFKQCHGGTTVPKT